MEEHLKRLPQDIRDLIYAVRDIAECSGVKAYLVGGFVRDLILGVNNLDLDIAVEGDGIAFARILARHFNSGITCHKRFGTAAVMVKPHLKVDIATTRKESYPEPGSLPVVSGGSLKDDLYRRDFTINTLVISLNRDNFGCLMDLFGGREDIRGKKIRVLHDRSFLDDPTRILRAARFEQRYDFSIEPLTLKCLDSAVKLKMLLAVEPQRLRDELIPLLKEKEPLKALKRLNALAGLDFIDPGLKLTAKTLRFLESAQEQVNWFDLNLPARRHLDRWLVYFAGILDGLEEPVISNICRRFALRRGDEKRIREFFHLRDKLLSRLSGRGIRASSVFHLLEPLSYEIIVLLKASTGNKQALANIEKFLHEYNGSRIVLKGNDLNGLGFVPGPHYQKILRKVLNARLDGKVKTAREELELVKKIKKQGAAVRGIPVFRSSERKI